jgi:hypothetical protein
VDIGEEGNATSSRTDIVPIPLQGLDGLTGAVALVGRMIKAGLSCEIRDGFCVVAADVSVYRVPVPTGGHRGGGALVSAVQPVLPRR